MRLSAGVIISMSQKLREVESLVPGQAAGERPGQHLPLVCYTPSS